MEQGIKGPAYEEYQALKATQQEVENGDFEPIIVDNIFSKEDIDEIYAIINSTPEEKTKLQTWAGHRAWHVPLGDKIVAKINEAVKRTFGDELVLRQDYSFARYSGEWGYKVKLFPHSDIRDSQRMTFDIQLNADEPWGIIVEDKTYFLENNQALCFAGTQQVHWREKKPIDVNSKIDMIFCHLEYVDDRGFEEHREDVLFERTRFLSGYYDLTSNDEYI
jgi:hypothetical protein